MLEACLARWKTILVAASAILQISIDKIVRLGELNFLYESSATLEEA